MKLLVDLVIVIPVGPTCKIEFIFDTISSIKHYIHSSYKIIISDDSQSVGTGAKVIERFPEVLVLKHEKNYGKGLGLYMTLSHAFCYAMDQFDFKALLRLDTDALIIGHDPELPIIEFFKKNPKMGLAGRYVKGVVSIDDFGNLWENHGRGLYVAIVKLFTRFYLRHPIINWRIRKLVFKAVNRGYELGELVFGGTYAFSPIGLEKLRDNELLPLKNLLGADLEEDHFFTMLIVSVGLELGDLASGDLPFACTWRGLPASPETLYEDNKKIIHSTRFWKDIKEEEIRKYFGDKRESATRLARSG